MAVHELKGLRLVDVPEAVQRSIKNNLGETECICPRLYEEGQLVGQKATDQLDLPVEDV